jgi:hypothetical protein
MPIRRRGDAHRLDVERLAVVGRRRRYPVAARDRRRAFRRSRDQRGDLDARERAEGLDVMLAVAGADDGDTSGLLSGGNRRYAPRCELRVRSTIPMEELLA